MTTFRLKRKFYSDKEGGMGLGTKIALGLGAAAATFGAAKSGMLGTTLAKGANKAWAAGGKMVGSQNMINSGAKGYGAAAAKEAAAAENFTKKEVANWAKQEEKSILDQFKLDKK